MPWSVLWDEKDEVPCMWIEERNKIRKCSGESKRKDRYLMWDRDRKTEAERERGNWKLRSLVGGWHLWGKGN